MSVLNVKLANKVIEALQKAKEVLIREGETHFSELRPRDKREIYDVVTNTIGRGHFNTDGDKSGSWEFFNINDSLRIIFYGNGVENMYETRNYLSNFYVDDNQTDNTVVAINKAISDLTGKKQTLEEGRIEIKKIKSSNGNRYVELSPSLAKEIVNALKKDMDDNAPYLQRYKAVVRDLDQCIPAIEILYSEKRLAENVGLKKRVEEIDLMTQYYESLIAEKESLEDRFYSNHPTSWGHELIKHCQYVIDADNADEEERVNLSYRSLWDFESIIRRPDTFKHTYAKFDKYFDLSDYKKRFMKDE